MSRDAADRGVHARAGSALGREEERKGTSRGACEHLSAVPREAHLERRPDRVRGQPRGRGFLRIKREGTRQSPISALALGRGDARAREPSRARRCLSVPQQSWFRQSAGGKGNVHACGSVPSSRPRCGPSASPSTRASASAMLCLWSKTSSRPSPLYRAPRGLTTRAPFSGHATIPFGAKRSSRNRSIEPVASSASKRSTNASSNPFDRRENNLGSSSFQPTSHLLPFRSRRFSSCLSEPGRTRPRAWLARWRRSRSSPPSPRVRGRVGRRNGARGRAAAARLASRSEAHDERQRGSFPSASAMPSRATRRTARSTPRSSR